MKYLISVRGVPINRCTPEEFNKEIQSVYRFFIPEEGIGVHMREALRRGYDPQIILRREDGWGS